MFALIRAPRRLADRPNPRLPALSRRPGARFLLRRKPQAILSARRETTSSVIRPSRYGRREIPLGTELAQALWRWKPVGATEEGLVFPSREGTPLNVSNLASRILKPAAKRAGVPWAGFHTLRHTCGTLLFRAGFNAKQVQMWLGHHSPAFTLATYVHLLPDDLPAPDDAFAFLASATEGQRLGQLDLPREPEILLRPSPTVMAAEQGFSSYDEAGLSG